MTGITSLPPEILAHILSYLPRKQDKHREQEEQEAQVEQYGQPGQDRQGEHPHNQDARCEQDKFDSDLTKQSSELPVYLPSYSTVCKTWHQQVELQTFREIDVMSSELEYLSKIMTESRRSTLRVMNYSIVMSKDVEMACAKGKEFTGEVEEAVEKAFTAAITELFVLLQEWEDENPLISLSMMITDIYTYNDGQREKATRCREQWNSIEKDMFKPYSRLLQLGSLDDLPKLKSVARLQVGSGNLHMTEDSMTRLAMKFPALKALDLQIGHMTWYAEGNNWGRELVPELRYRMC